MTPTMLESMSVTELDGVGEKMAEKLEKLGINSVQDLLFHLPFRYEDRTRIWPIANLQPGQSASIEAEILSHEISYGRKRMLLVRVRDHSGALTLRFFNFSAAMKNSFIAGKTLRAFGEIKRGHHGPEIIHPDYQIVSEQKNDSLADTLTPVYPSTDGVKQITLRNLTEQALVWLEKAPLPELLPDDLYPEQMPLNQALKLLHRPPPALSIQAFETGNHPAQQRLICEELIAQHLSMLKIRHQLRTDPAHPLPPSKNSKQHYSNHCHFNQRAHKPE